MATGVHKLTRVALLGIFAGAVGKRSESAGPSVAALELPSAHAEALLDTAERGGAFPWGKKRPSAKEENERLTTELAARDAAVVALKTWLCEKDDEVKRLAEKNAALSKELKEAMDNRTTTDAAVQQLLEKNAELSQMLGDALELVHQNPQEPQAEAPRNTSNRTAQDKQSSGPWWNPFA